MGLWTPDGAVGVPVIAGELGQTAFKGPFQLKSFYDSVISMVVKVPLAPGDQRLGPSCSL